jgi:hypothetical protein
MLTARYLLSTKNLSAILKKIVDGVAPDKFTTEHLKSIGFGSSQDRAVIPLLKDLGFLGSDGTPTQRYHAYRDQSKSRAVMAEALREAYEDVFHIREVPTDADRGAVEGLFKTKTNASDRVAQLQAMTFYGLLAHADMKAGGSPSPTLPEVVKREPPPEVATQRVEDGNPRSMAAELHYTIQIHLPATKDIEVFNAIFRSLRDNLLA